VGRIAFVLDGNAGKKIVGRFSVGRMAFVLGEKAINLKNAKPIA